MQSRGIFAGICNDYNTRRRNDAVPTYQRLSSSQRAISYSAPTACEILFLSQLGRFLAYQSLRHRSEILLYRVTSEFSASSCCIL